MISLELIDKAILSSELRVQMIDVMRVRVRCPDYTRMNNGRHGEILESLTLLHFFFLLYLLQWTGHGPRTCLWVVCVPKAGLLGMLSVR